MAVACAAALARSEGIADGGFRLVVNAGDDGGQTVGHLHRERSFAAHYVLHVRLRDADLPGEAPHCQRAGGDTRLQVLHQAIAQVAYGDGSRGPWHIAS